MRYLPPNSTLLSVICALVVSTPAFAEELADCDTAATATAAPKCTLVALPFIGYSCVNNGCNQHCALLADFEDGHLSNYRCRCKKKKVVATESVQPEEGEPLTQ